MNDYQGQSNTEILTPATAKVMEKLTSTSDCQSQSNVAMAMTESPHPQCRQFHLTRNSTI